ncbi:hypothetical protein D3C80_1646360 [compost metagenome]
MQAPVEEGNAHGAFRRFGAHGRGAEGVALHMEHRLGDAPEDQTDTLAGGKHHGEPGKVTELGSFILTPQANATEAAKGQPGVEE